MSIQWSYLIEKIYKEIDDIIINCSTCSSNSKCIEDLTPTLPIDIKILDGCCSCVFENMLEAIPNINRLYTYSLDTNELISIYVLDDIVIELTQTTLTLIPLTLIDAYLELVNESNYRDAKTIIEWLKRVTKK